MSISRKPDSSSVSSRHLDICGAFDEIARQCWEIPELRPFADLTTELVLPHQTPILGELWMRYSKLLQRGTNIQWIDSLVGAPSDASVSALERRSSKTPCGPDFNE